MKKILMCGMLLGLLSSVSVAQRGRAMGNVSPTPRPMPSATARGTILPPGSVTSPAPSPTVVDRRAMPVTPNGNPTAAPNRTAGASTTIAPSATTTGTPKVKATAAPNRGAGVSRTPAPNATTRVSDTQQ